MAVDKLVDSTQLGSDLTSVANAIRTKGGTSAQLAFPADFISAINAISGGGGGGATHVQYTATSNATSAAAGGNTKNWYDTYMAPNIPSSGNVIVIGFITNNSASGNYGRAMLFLRDSKLSGSNLKIYWRGASGTGATFGTNYDFLWTSGSLFDIYTLEDALT